MGLRHLAEIASRNVRYRRTLPEQFRKRRLYVSPGCGLSYWRRKLSAADEWLLGMARELVRPGNVVWDIGANLGMFSFSASVMAGPGGSVVAVEADTWLVDLLRRTESLAFSEAASVTILPVAASDQVGIVAFNIAKRARAANHLSGTGSSQSGGIRERHTVVSITLDWLLERTAAPDVVKIDVEGAEEMVLTGATRVLGKARPRILCEVCEHNAVAVTRQLEACGYEIYDAEVEQHKRVPIARAVWNTLAVPK